MLIRLAAIAALLVVAACDPKIKVADLDGRNAKNNAFRVVIDPDVPFRAAVLAQELYEAEAKRDPVRAIEVRLDSSAERKLEITGHEVEVQAAALIYGQDEAAYRAKEAASMHRGYGGLFRDMPVAEIIAAMEARKPTARQWVERNRVRLEPHK